MFGGNPWVGGGDGKIIPQVGLGDLPSEGEGGVVFPFGNVTGRYPALFSASNNLGPPTPSAASAAASLSWTS